MDKIMVPVLVQGRVAKVVRCWTRFPADNYVKKLQERGCHSARVGGRWVRADATCHFECAVNGVEEA